MNSWRLREAALPRNLNQVLVTPNWMLFPTRSAGNYAAKTLPPALGQNFIHSLIHSFWGRQVLIEHLLGAKHWVENTIENKILFLCHRAAHPAQGLTQMNEKLLRGTCMVLSPR